MRYEVAFTDIHGRKFEEFNDRDKATKYAKSIINKGATGVFIDTYDGDDLVDYQGILNKGEVK